MSLSDWLKGQGFKSVNNVAEKIGVSRYTVLNWYNNPQKLKDVLIPRLALLKQAA